MTVVSEFCYAKIYIQFCPERKKIVLNFTLLSPNNKIVKTLVIFKDLKNDTLTDVGKLYII